MSKRKHSSGTDRIAEAAGQLELDQDTLIVNIQGDQPVFNSLVISDMLSPMIEDRTIPMGTLKYKITDEG